MDVKCPGCFAITTVFSHAQTVVVCGSCAQVLSQPTGGKARLTEGTYLSLPSRPCALITMQWLTSSFTSFRQSRLLFPSQGINLSALSTSSCRGDRGGDGFFTWATRHSSGGGCESRTTMNDATLRSGVFREGEWIERDGRGMAGLGWAGPAVAQGRKSISLTFSLLLVGLVHVLAASCLSSQGAVMSVNLHPKGGSTYIHSS